MSKVFQAMQAILQADVATLVREGGSADEVARNIGSLLDDLAAELEHARQDLQVLVEKARAEQQGAGQWLLQSLMALKAGNDETARQALEHKAGRLEAAENLERAAGEQQRAIEQLERVIALARDKQRAVEQHATSKGVPPAAPDPERVPAATGRRAFDLVLGSGASLPVYPWLVRPDWERVSTCVSRPLVHELGVPELPLVALCHRVNPGLGFVSRARLYQLGCSHAAIEQEAVANLSRLPADWDVTQLAGTPIASYQGDDLAAGRILDVAFMSRAAVVLEARSELVVAIPRRGLIMAADLGRPEAAGYLTEVARSLFAEAEGQGVTSHLFQIVGGVLRGICRGPT